MASFPNEEQNIITISCSLHVPVYACVHTQYVLNKDKVLMSVEQSQRSCADRIQTLKFKNGILGNSIKIIK